MLGRVPSATLRSAWVTRGHASPSERQEAHNMQIVLPLSRASPTSYEETDWIRARVRGRPVHEWIRLLIDYAAVGRERGKTVRRHGARM